MINRSEWGSVAALLLGETNGDPKFIIHHIPETEQQHETFEFAHISDGRVIGAVIGRIVVHDVLNKDGEMDRKQIGFTDQQYALDFMKQKCRVLLGREDLGFIHREAEKRVPALNLGGGVRRQ